MTTMRTRMLGLVVAAGLAATAAQAVPPAFDHVPADTPVVIGIQSLSELMSDAEKWMGHLAPPEAGMGLMMAQQMLQIPGLNPDGSAAVALTFPNGPDRSEPVPVIVVPVSDFAAMTEALEGEAGDGVVTLSMNGEQVFAKDLGGGFAALGPAMELIQGFNGSAGKAKAHAARLGVRGNKASDEADIFAVVDVASMRPLLDEALAEMEQNMEMMAMMAGEGAAAQMEMMANAAKAVVEDGRTAFIGLGAGEDGMWLDFAGQFADGSDTGNIFKGSGDSTPMFAALPNMNFIFATAFDTSDPGIRGLMKSATSLTQGMGMGMKTPEMIELNDGGSMMIGVTPGLFAGGLFANTVNFTASKDPQGLLKAMKEATTAMDGQSQEGVLFHTTWEDDAKEIAGRSVDAWGVSMEGDPNHPQGAQAGMMLQQMTILFGGQAGPSGYVAATDKGLYSSFSKNTKLMERVLTGEGESLAANADIASVAAHLPEGRTGEAYVNVKGILDMFLPMLGMFGMSAEMPEMPESMRPIGIGMASGGGGMHARLFVPGDVIEFISTTAEQMSGGDEWEEVDEEPESEPRF